VTRAAHGAHGRHAEACLQKDPRAPWDVTRAVGLAVLMLNLLANCEIPRGVEGVLPALLDRCTALVGEGLSVRALVASGCVQSSACGAVQEMARNPAYPARAGLSGKAEAEYRAGRLLQAVTDIRLHRRLVSRTPCVRGQLTRLPRRAAQEEARFDSHAEALTRVLLDFHSDTPAAPGQLPADHDFEEAVRVRIFRDDEANA
jgi:hypothetical protein